MLVNFNLLNKILLKDTPFDMNLGEVIGQPLVRNYIGKKIYLCERGM